MSVFILQSLKNYAIRNFNRNLIKIPRNTIIEKRKISILSSIHLYNQNQEKSTSGLAGADKKKSKDVIKITLLGPNNSISVVSLEEAKNLSRRRDLELVKIQDYDTKTQRPVYKLLTKAELIAQEVAELEGNVTGNEDNKKITSKKVEKNLTIGSKITDHDLNIRLKNLLKWLNKGYEVRILIQCSVSDVATGDKIFNKFETLIKEENCGRIVQKHIKNGNIKFSILPTTVKKES